MSRIRLAEREDLNTLFALDRACFRAGIAYSKAELKYFLFRPHSISLVIEHESGEGGTSVAGFAVAEIRAEGGRRAGHIVTIDVDPARRRQGAGRLLMDALIERCRERGAALLRLEVAVDNDGAIAFYKLRGFVETGRIRGFYMGRLDALTMEFDVEADAPSAPS